MSSRGSRRKKKPKRNNWQSWKPSKRDSGKKRRTGLPKRMLRLSRMICKKKLRLSKMRCKKSRRKSKKMKILKSIKKIILKRE